MLNNYKNYLNTMKNIADNLVVFDRNGTKIDVDDAFVRWCKILSEIKSSERRKIAFIGNGGSAGIASHCATDYSKNGNIRSLAFNDATTLTCLSNDYSYEEVFSKQIEYHGFENDLLVAISSSGNSKNIINALEAAKRKKMITITLSGFKKDNFLKKLGDMNFYINSMEYGFVEILHLTVIHTALDLFLERK
tara:strand:- start:738 stop:1313 length:576 start_codon:yes stop_codon:yes gene_type:complete